MPTESSSGVIRGAAQGDTGWRTVYEGAIDTLRARGYLATSLILTNPCAGYTTSASLTTFGRDVVENASYGTRAMAVRATVFP